MSELGAGKNVLGIQWVKARDAAKCLTRYRAAPAAKDDPDPDVERTEAEKSCFEGRTEGSEKQSIRALKMSRFSPSLCLAKETKYFLWGKKSYSFKNFLNWRIIDLQHCIGFCCTTQVSHSYIYIPSLLSLPPSAPLSRPLGRHGAPGWAPCVK